MIEAKIRLPEGDAWFSWRGVRYELTPGWYLAADLVAAINLATEPNLLLTISTDNGPDPYLVILPADSGDAWTLDAGRGILYFLGLENNTSGANNPGGIAIAVDADPISAYLLCEVRRRWGVLKQYNSPHSHKAVGTIYAGSARPEDSIILSDFSEGLALRFLDQVAGGRLVVDGYEYFLLDDAVQIQRDGEEVFAELLLAEQALPVDYLLVAGGGGGGGRTGAGGGGGGVLFGTVTIDPGVFAVVVGTGGLGGVSSGTATGEARRGDSGTNSSALGLTALGGGGGGAAISELSGLAGGSGGGAQATGTAGAGTAGQGFDGWATPSANWGGSGGGAGEAGQPGIIGAIVTSGIGGDGIASTISGASVYYGGGGGGGVRKAAGRAPGTGGLGGGGAGGEEWTLARKDAVDGTDGLGGGGGGAGRNDSYADENNSVGGKGGSGVVIIRYLGAQRATGGTVTQVGGYTIHTFTTSGTWRLI